MDFFYLDICRQYLKDLKIDKDLTLDEIANITNFDRTYISKLISGNRGSLDALISIIGAIDKDFIYDLAYCVDELDKLIDNIIILNENEIDNIYRKLDSHKLKHSLNGYRYLLYKEIYNRYVGNKVDQKTLFRLSICKSVFSDKDRALLNMAIGNYYCDLKKHQESITYYIKAFSYTIKDLIYAYIRYCAIETLDSLRMNYLVCVSLDDAIQIFRSFDLKRRLSCSLVLLANVYLNFGKYDKAVDLYEVLLKQNDPIYSSVVINNLLGTYAIKSCSKKIYDLLSRVDDSAVDPETHFALLSYAYHNEDDDLFESEYKALSKCCDDPFFSDLTSMLYFARYQDLTKVTETYNRVISICNENEYEIIYYVLNDICRKSLGLQIDNFKKGALAP